MFAVIAVLGVIFGFQVEKLDKYNNLLFNLLFSFARLIFGLNQLSDTKIYIINGFNKYETLNLLLY